MSNVGNIHCSQRKQWSSSREASVPFQKHRSYLAEDGCPDYQVSLAKRLLENNGSVNEDAEENAQQGVYWLIKASKQGHPEATSLLRECVGSRRGITEHNYIDAKECLETPDDEKQAVKVARDIFSLLCDDEDFITTHQLRSALKLAERVTAGLSEETSRKVIRDLLSGNIKNAEEVLGYNYRLYGHGAKITEENLIQAAQTYSHGDVPTVCRALVWKDLNVRSGCRGVWFNSIMHPLATVYAFYCSISELLSMNVLFLFLCAIFPQLQMIILILCIPTVKIAYFQLIIPPIIYYFSLTVMISATFQILCHRRDFEQLRSWSNLFILYSHGSFDASRPELQHGKKIIRAHFWFYTAFIIHSALLYFNNFTPMFQSECAIIAFLFTFLLLHSSSVSRSNCLSRIYSVDYLSVISFIFYVIAKYPYERDTVVNVGYRFIYIHFPTYITYLIGNVVDFCSKNYSYFYIFIPPMLLKMAARNKWSGVYTDFIPHCTVLLWWQLTLLYSEGATWYGLTRSALILAAFIMFLPLTCICTIAAPIYVAVEFCKSYENFIAASAFVIFSVGLTFITLYVNRCRSPAAKFFTALQLIIAITAFTIIVLEKRPKVNTNMVIKSAELELDDFLKYCKWDYSDTSGNTVNSQLSCATMIGAKINWKGYVKDIKLAKIENPILYITSGLYPEIAEIIHCLFGEKFTFCYEESNVCTKFTHLCHVNSWNRYEYNIDVQVSANAGIWKMSPAHRLRLVASNSFSNFTQDLVIDDYIWFSGTLLGDSNGLLAAELAHVKLIEAGCLICANNISPHTTTLISSDISRTVNFILNFFFHPLISFE